MKVKRIIAVLLAVIIAIAAVPVQVRAEEVYTVVLKAGTGSGDDIVYCSYEGTIADSWKSAANCQFYRCDNNRMGFNLSNKYCPDSFTAPDGWCFYGWEDNREYNDNISPTTTFTAKWWEDTTASKGPIDGIPKTSRGEDFYLNGMKWHVIGEDKNKWLAISSGLLEAADSLTMSWDKAMAYCGNVYDGFSDCEKASLLKVTKTDEKYQYGSIEYDGDDYASSLNETSVFLLSMPEANWYFADNDARVCNEWYSCGWWLRSHMKGFNIIAGAVDSDGGLVNDIDNYNSRFGFRPAFVLNRSSVLFTSAAEGGKSSAKAGKGFGNFQDGGTGAKKLTLLDSTRSGFSADVGDENSAMAVPGGSVEIKYSRAGTESNEYVSAMLCNSEGTVIGYASVVADSDGEGTWSLTLPSNLTEGVYKLKVFSEQQNGNHLTDYASIPVEIGLTVGSIPGWSPEAPVETVETVEMHRLYNPNSGEHFYTGNLSEKDSLINEGWNYEGVAWNTPVFSLNPVYRLYSKDTGDHRYTKDVDEKDDLISRGFCDEGIGWYSDETESIPVFGLYNKNALQAGAYHFTADVSERDSLIELGWTDEGIGWYGKAPSAA